VLIAGNWKMHKGPTEAREFCRELSARVEPIERVQIVVSPPYVSLEIAVEELEGSGVDVFAQSVHWADEGAFTGEISPSMLLELGVDGALIAHSERRVLFGETDDSAARRIDAALEAGLQVIACVGETEDERDDGETRRVLERQVSAITRVADAYDRELLVIAYEPVWAIGTGRTATPEQAEEEHAFIRSLVEVPVIYGGSVKPENAEELLTQSDVDGALIGGASLDLESFASVCETAARITS
jgi:triosephosphate isomerase (TIM)